LHEPNVCVLDIADYKVDNEGWLTEEILKADRKIRERLKLPYRGGRMIQPWFAGKKEHPELCDLALRFKFGIDTIPEKIILACETPEEFEIKVNGRNAAALTGGYWVDPCFKLLAIDPCALTVGDNEITLSTRFRADINLEAIYLLGDFGVKLVGSKPIITALPNTLAIGSVVSQGLPFYGSGISYYIDLPECKDGEHMSIFTPHIDAACLKVKSGEIEKLVFTRPYEADVTQMAGQRIELQYLLTRRNTFGPLHMPHKKIHWYGPQSFITEGEDFNLEYQLLPQGMTAEVMIKLSK